MQFADWEQQDEQFDEGLDDVHREPEGEVCDVEGHGGAAGEVVRDGVPRVANFDDKGGGEPGADGEDEDEGGVPEEVGGVEEGAVEAEDGDLGEGDDGEGEGAVDVDVLWGGVC